MTSCLNYLYNALEDALSLTVISTYKAQSILYLASEFHLNWFQLFCPDHAIVAN